MRGRLKNNRGFPKTSVFGKATTEKACFAAFRRETARGLPKLTEFWENLNGPGFEIANLKSLNHFC
jgi:hypothetical protein